MSGSVERVYECVFVSACDVYTYFLPSLLLTQGVITRGLCHEPTIAPSSLLP